MNVVKNLLLMCIYAPFLLAGLIYAWPLIIMMLFVGVIIVIVGIVEEVNKPKQSNLRRE